MKLYTKRGDDGTTGLLHGGRLGKSAPAVEAYGTVDEAQALLGLVRAEVRGSELDALLVQLERDLWVLMADLATAEENRHKLEPDRSLVTAAMVARLEAHIDELAAGAPLPDAFAVPGQNRVAALLDVARTVVRRAERRAVDTSSAGSMAVPYLNRLSDLLWAMARREEGDEVLPARSDGSAGPGPI